MKQINNKKHSVIRFHPSELNKANVDIDDRVDMTSSWFKIYKARCWESSSERRPLILQRT